jgi:hypothetical protein
VHAEGERVILTHAAGGRQEIDLTPPAAPADASAELPTPVCPAGEVEGLSAAAAGLEPPAPGTSPLDALTPPTDEAPPSQEGGAA